MSIAAGPEGSGIPRIPQPGHTPEELRAALTVVDPGALPTFDAERQDALREARDNVSAAPMRRFVGQWAVNVAIARDPARAARFHELQARAQVIDDLDEARAVTAEIGRILDAACVEAGVTRETVG